MRWLRRLLLFALLLAAATFGTGWYLLASSRAQLEERVAVAGLEHSVTILRDRDGVATFEAATRTDLAYAPGYVHAQERFFEMDLMRRVAGPAGGAWPPAPGLER
jgi:penicillin amidase